jgi:membrane-bound serine protease (ClpP class)
MGQDGRVWRVALASLFILVGTLLHTAGSTSAQDTTGDQLVVVIPIRGTIEPGIGHFLQRSLDEAAEDGADLVILDIETPGGRLDTVLQMRDAILGSSVPVVAFVNREAFSAGALITIASDEIWMAPGGVFGAATPVLGDETADEKTVSAVRSTFRSTAEEQGRDPLIAEAMVDPAVVVPGLDDSTSLLTLSVAQAQEWGYTDGVAADLPTLIDSLGYSDATIREMSLSPIEYLVRWITDPIFASLLILAGLFLIIADAVFAGFGIAAVAGVACLGLFFWGHTLAGLAGWEDMVLVAIGIVLIAVELFVVPGFGVAGVLGIVSLASGLVLAMSGRDFGNFRLTDDVIRAGWAVAAALGLLLVALGALTLIMPKNTSTRRFGGLALAATVDDSRQGTRSSQRARSGWLVNRFGGSGVLEKGDVHMPEATGKPGNMPRD